jgi:hemoglobin
VENRRTHHDRARPGHDPRMSDQPQDSPTSHALVGGDSAVRALVDRFYDLMDIEPVYAAIRALHPATLDGSRDKLYWFLSGWLGGPQHYVERFGHPRLRARHLPYVIGIRERDQWLACMRQAMAEQHVDAQLADRLYESFFNTADWMRNQGG